MKKEKSSYRYSYSKSSMAKFEAFGWNFSSSTIPENSEKKFNFFFISLLDMDIMGTENRETAITLLNEDQAAHRYEDIPIAASEKEKTTKNLKNMATASKLESKSLDNDAGIVIENTEKNVEKNTNEKDSSVNYGYHPIIDFFGNFRFDTA